MKKLTRRSWGVGNDYKVKKLNELIRGWINYFKIGSIKGLCRRYHIGRILVIEFKEDEKAAFTR